MRIAWTVPVAALVLACGSLADVDKRPPLAVVEGQLTQGNQSTATAPTNVRIALLWVTHGAKEFMTTQDVEATPVFPSKFRIDLTDPPPASVTIHSQDDPRSLPPGAALAVATLIAYEDRNGNGQLDLVGNDDPAFIDHVLGANRDLTIVYLEGVAGAPLAFANGSTPALGYNLLRNTVCPWLTRPVDPPAPGEPPSTPPPDPPCDKSRDGWYPMTTLYDLPISGDPIFETAMCKEGGLFYANAVETEPPPEAPVSGGGDSYPPHSSALQPWPPKGDPMVTCAPDGRAYAYKTCTYTSQGLCQPPLSACSTYWWGLPTGTTPPPEWPCPIP
jgi:hypothetical protein